MADPLVISKLPLLLALALAAGLTAGLPTSADYLSVPDSEFAEASAVDVMKPGELSQFLQAGPEDRASNLLQPSAVADHAYPAGALMQDPPISEPELVAVSSKPCKKLADHYDQLVKLANNPNPKSEQVQELILRFKAKGGLKRTGVSRLGCCYDKGELAGYKTSALYKVTCRKSRREYHETYAAHQRQLSRPQKMKTKPRVRFDPKMRVGSRLMKTNFKQTRQNSRVKDEISAKKNPRYKQGKWFDDLPERGTGGKTWSKHLHQRWIRLDENGNQVIKEDANGNLIGNGEAVLGDMVPTGNPGAKRYMYSRESPEGKKILQDREDDIKSKRKTAALQEKGQLAGVKELRKSAATYNREAREAAEEESWARLQKKTVERSRKKKLGQGKYAYNTQHQQQMKQQMDTKKQQQGLAKEFLKKRNNKNNKQHKELELVAVSDRRWA